MSIAQSDERLKAENISFRALARENTGAHMLDSGSAYGRHHEKPDIPEDGDLPVILPQDPQDLWDLYIGTPAFLEHWYEIDRELQAEFDEFVEENEDSLDHDGFSFQKASWGDLLEAFMEHKGYVDAGFSGNAYNSECHLSQVFTWYTYHPVNEDCGEPIYRDENLVTAIRLHNGCDVRGGYSRPVFVESMAYEYSVPLNFTISVETLQARIPYSEIEYQGNALGGRFKPYGHNKKLVLNGRDACQYSPFETWRRGYTNNGLYQFGEDVERIFWHTWDPEYCTVGAKLEDGTLVHVRFEAEGPSGAGIC